MVEDERYIVPGRLALLIFHQISVFSFFLNGVEGKKKSLRSLSAFILHKNIFKYFSSGFFLICFDP
jgi:hypothetical protein